MRQTVKVGDALVLLSVDGSLLKAGGTFGTKDAATCFVRTLQAADFSRVRRFRVDGGWMVQGSVSAFNVESAAALLSSLEP